MGNKQDKEIKTFSSNHHPERYNSNNKIHCHSSVKHQGPLVTNDIPKVTNQQLKHLAEHRQTPIKENHPLEQSSTSWNRNPSLEKRSRTTNPKSQPSKIVTAQQIIEKQRKHRDESSSIQKSASASAISQSSSTKNKSTHRQKQIPQDLKLMLIHPHDIKVLLTKFVFFTKKKQKFSFVFVLDFRRSWTRKFWYSFSRFTQRNTRHCFEMFTFE